MMAYDDEKEKALMTLLKQYLKIPTINEIFRLRKKGT